ncbi:hypothetical protein [Streptococcus pneumoniae]|uniref:hypothetical protein n=1 Tax=Streptococcus pneumoniae TaxID=1313 RepID=UPI0005DFBA95|nr:hypothetical protein [Streptococcus pneumoniae]CKB99608.1 Tn5253 hypothetical protein [Streptococcus pneumoniae]
MSFQYVHVGMLVLIWGIELTRKMFAGEFHYPSELNRLYQKIRHYKVEQRMPQSPWVERIVQVLDLDYEDLFRR